MQSTSFKWAAWLTVALTGVASATGVRALCAAPMEPRPYLVAEVHRLARGSAILLAAADGQGAELRIGGQRVALSREPIAHRLVALRVPADAPLGRGQLVGALPTVIDLEIVGDPLPGPPAEAPRGMLTRSDTPLRDGASSSRFEASVEGDAPADVVALVAAWSGQSVWTSSRNGAVVLGSSGRCGGSSPLPPVGERVTLFWLDRHGRRSPASPPIVVR